MPVDQYIRGAEHAVLHLLYARFFCKVLRDLKYIDVDEPFKALFNQGIVHKDGEKMSKSKGNVVSQDEVEEKYGIDTARLFMLFVANPGKDIEWSDEGVQGSYRFLQKLEGVYDAPGKASAIVTSKVHATLQAVTEHLDHFELNKALLAILDCVDTMIARGSDAKSLELLTQMLAPFVPHVAEELWSRLGHKDLLAIESWPAFDAKKINPEFDYHALFIDTLVKDIGGVLRLKQMKPKSITLFVAEQWKYDVFDAVRKQSASTKNVKVIMDALMKTEFKKNAEFIAKTVPKLVMEPGRIPTFLLGQKREAEVLDEAVAFMANKFECDVTVVLEQKSAEPKAKNALPGKPAIVVE